MRLLICAALVLVFTVGCGKDGTTPNVNAMNSIRSMLNLLMPAASANVAKVPVDQLPQILKQIANSGLLGSQSSNFLLEPANQQILQDVIKLAQGGSKSDQQATAIRLTASASGPQISNVVGTILKILTAVAPLLSTFMPGLGGIVGILVQVLPVIMQIIGQIGG